MLALHSTSGLDTRGLDTRHDISSQLLEEASYTSVWCALDDVDESNGAMLLLPFDAPQPASPWFLPADGACEAWLGSEGRRHSVAAHVQAGDVVVFSSRLWHCSEPNMSDTPRRAFYAQYSPKAIGGESPIWLAIRTEPSLTRMPPLTPAYLVGISGSTLYETDDEPEQDVANEDTTNSMQPPFERRVRRREQT